MDDALAASFPASDPPAWNPGLARPVPVDELRDRVTDVRPTAPRGERAAATRVGIGVSRPYRSEWTLLQVVTSLAGAAAVVLLVPFVILLVGLPIALAVRGLLEVVLWLFPAIG
jgi:hypothetical protein